MIYVPVTCQVCGGTGWNGKHICERCNGEGTVSVPLSQAKKLQRHVEDDEIDIDDEEDDDDDRRDAYCPSCGNIIFGQQCHNCGFINNFDW